MLIPIRTDRPARRTPIVTQGLIVVNMLVYLAGLVGTTFGVLERETMAAWGHFDPLHFQVWQLITYQFLHDPSSVFHLAFNMLFLWVFGSAVENRLGRPGFLAFYLVGGAVAGLAHMATSPAPVIGASGAVAGVSGAFLALSPRARVMALFVFFIIGIVHIPAAWFIGFYFLIDLLFVVFGGAGRNVAYTAHLAGYAYGFTVSMALLATGVLKREEFDVLFLFRQARRRAAFRAAGRGQAGGMWESASADTGRQLKRRRPPVDESGALRHAKDRSTIGRLIQEHDLPAAAERYRVLLDKAPDEVLAEQQQLDMASQLYALQHWPAAGRACELFLERYAASHRAGEVRLLLGLLYTRYLQQPDRARSVLEDAGDRWADDGQRTLARQLRLELEA